MQDTEDATLDLTGKLLIAMPGMGDARFDRSVIFVCAHSPEGAMGLIINKPTPDLAFRDLLEQLDITMQGDDRDILVHLGGPVEHGRGFVLHSAETPGRDTSLAVDEAFAMTATLDILEDLATGRGPDQALLALGYAGWGPSQLEAEIANNGWLTTDAPRDLVFARDASLKWEKALATLGISPLVLSADAGRA
ncbi:MAG: YqgE/AlgH family protein [Celeribacter sp.]|jgi:putative transcriptional regulator